VKFNAGEERHVRETWRAAALRLEDLAPAGQNFVQRFTKIRSGLRDIFADLFGIFLPAFLYLLLENLLEISVTQAILSLGGVIDHHI
jgi:hypothetical protein